MYEILLLLLLLLLQIIDFVFKVYNGNTDQESEVTNMFGCSIIAKYLRIRPVDWRSHISLRFEVLGCPTKSGIKCFIPQCFVFVRKRLTLQIVVIKWDRHFFLAYEDDLLHLEKDCSNNNHELKYSRCYGKQ